MISRKFKASLVKVGGADCEIELDVELQYNAEGDPLAVKAIFSDEHSLSPVEWHFSRKLMMDGAVCGFAIGTGDVKFRYEGALGGIIACLRSPEGHADIRLPQPEVVSFLNDTNREVPIGQEDLGTDLDDELERIFGA
jgi:hypothetical protein